jgi:hypothetical protein
MISIFAKRGFLGNHYHDLVKGDTILRLSGETRGAQIAENIGAKINPTEGYENDLCIFVKGFNMQKAKTGDYVDFSDEAVDRLAPFLIARPDVNVIAHSLYAYNFLKDKLPNKVVLIPQQHINWENAGRVKNNPIVGGYIGRPSHISVEIQNEIKETLANIGVEFVIAFEWTTRQDAVDFYKKVDFLVLGGYGKLPSELWQITPTKMINAAAFGVPSIAFMRVGYEEFEGYYTQFKTMEDLIGEVEKLKDDQYYQEYADRIKKKAEEYHVSKIGELYKNLDDHTI